MAEAPPLDTPEQTEPPMLRGALDLLELAGVLIVPSHHVLPDGSCSCADATCKHQGKHPRGNGWQLRASADPHELRRIWARWPDAGVGIATGIAGGIVVIDVDGIDGAQTLAALEAEHGALPITPTVLTSRGRHLYFAAGLIPLHNRQGARGRGLGKGIDLRAEGGFVMAPPSKHPSGTTYAWAPGLSIGEIAPPALPAWVVEFGRARPQAVPDTLPPRPVPVSRAEKWAEAALDAECKAVSSAAQGQRNHTLNTAAFNLAIKVAGGALDGGVVRRALQAAALQAGLSEFEAQKTIRSGMAAGAKKDQQGAPMRDLPGYERTNGHAQPMAAEAVGGGGDDGSSEPEGPDAPTAEPPPSAMQPRFNTAALFAALPTQRWVVPGLQLGPGRPTLIAGYGASAKTISVQALAVAVASGRPIWGRFECSPMVVLHIDYEQGYYATAKRYQRLALGMGLDWRELSNRLHYVEMPRAYLDKKGGEEEYMRACEGVDLVIVDALRGAAPHSDENDSAFRSSVDVLTYCSQRTGVSAIVLHHAGKPKKEAGGAADARTVARGSSAIYDASGCVLNFIARPGESARLVQQVKQPAESEGQGLDAFELLVEDVAIDGAPTAGARVVWRQPVPVDVGAVAALAFERDAALVLRAIRRVPEGQSGNAVVAKCGVGRGRALDVLRALADEGRIELIPGRGKGKLYRLAGEEASHG